MTSKLTREKAQWLHDACEEAAAAGIKLTMNPNELLMFTSYALAAMDSEPVAYSLIFRNMDGALNNYINTNTTFSTRAKAEAYGKGGSYETRSDGRLEWVPNTALDPVVVPLYRHAQPAPVVPDDVLDALQKVARIRLDLNDFDGDRRGIADCLGDAEEALIEVVNRRAAMLQVDNSPAQSDYCPAQNSVAPAKSPIDHGYRPECECSGCKATARICDELSANSSANPDCWCRTCRPVVLNDMRFVVCPDCGNKRCPRANDHRNACTGSNEPGQEGSAYPADPQEVPDGK